MDTTAITVSPPGADWAFAPELRQGLAVQLDLLDLWEAAGEPLGGWKVGLTSGRSRDAMGPGFRPFGYVLSSRIVESGSAVAFGSIVNPYLEPELCFRLGNDLSGPDLTPADVRAAVESVAAGFEVNEVRRVSQFTPSSLRLADGLANWGIVAAQGQPVMGGRLQDTPVTVRFNGVVVHEPSPVLMDDPFLSIAELCRTLSYFARGLRAGQRVITGSFSHHRVSEPGVWSAEFEQLGSVSVSIE